MTTRTSSPDTQKGNTMKPRVICTVVLMLVFCTYCKNRNIAALAIENRKADSVQNTAVANPMNTASFFSVVKRGDGKRFFGGVENVVFRSADGGQTWQDISEGLPDNVQKDGFFANESGLYLRAGKELYHTMANATIPFWTRENFPDDRSSIAPGKRGIIAYNYEGKFLQKRNGASAWSPVYTNFQQTVVRTIFESDGGSVFVGNDHGLFRSMNQGETWKQVQTGSWVMKLVESNGVLLATTERGIIRSTDNGETWDLVISEGGVGIAVESINGGFAAITYNTISETRRVRTSYDGGNTWEPIDAGLPASPMIASIIQVGNYFYCGHPDGVFRSSDKGKTWKLLLPSMESKVFNLSGSGNVIYAIARSGGC
jgi:photosystem II stability/assembly factor-like uncharacterized protein